MIGKEKRMQEFRGSIHLPNDLCCGCSACALSCPTRSIVMNFNEQGVYVPKINEKSCICCGRCVDICKEMQDRAPKLSIEHVYVAAAKDRTVLNRSSSGGIAYILSKKMLELGAPVCGVTYDLEDECAKHTVVRRIKDLEKLQGSKYLQSMNCDAFYEMISSESGAIFGTPCQIRAADRLLRHRNMRDKFLLVDIFCHGVPIELLWENHLAWLKRKRKLAGHCNVVFREGKKYHLNIGHYHARYNQDAFYTFFLLGWLKNRACYDCSLRRDSCADLRIGDCMVPKYDRLWFSPSTVIANTEQGLNFLKSCLDELEIYLEPYTVVDGIQEKDNVPLPKEYEQRVKLLQEGYAPEDIIHRVMIVKRIKSFIKHDLLERIRHRKSTDDLGGLSGCGKPDF